MSCVAKASPCQEILCQIKKNPAKGEAGPRWPRYAEDGKHAPEACVGSARQPNGLIFCNLPGWFPVPLQAFNSATRSFRGTGNLVLSRHDGMPCSRPDDRVGAH